MCSYSLWRCAAWSVLHTNPNRIIVSHWFRFANLSKCTCTCTCICIAELGIRIRYSPRALLTRCCWKVKKSSRRDAGDQTDMHTHLSTSLCRVTCTAQGREKLLALATLNIHAYTSNIHVNVQIQVFSAPHVTKQLPHKKHEQLHVPPRYHVFIYMYYGHFFRYCPNWQSRRGRSNMKISIHVQCRPWWHFPF